MTFSAGMDEDLEMPQEFQLGVDVPRLANLKVFTADGAALTLGRVWKNQVAILIFLRHFACLACRAHAAQVWADRDKYEKGGGKLVFIGNGSAKFIDIFKTDLGIGSALVLTDPSLEAFRAAGFRHGFSYILNARSVTTALKLFKDGHRQVTYTKEAGVHQQLGGVLAMGTDGAVLYHYISEFFGDFPEEPYLEVIQADESRKSLNDPAT